VGYTLHRDFLNPKWDFKKLWIYLFHQ